MRSSSLLGLAAVLLAVLVGCVQPQQTTAPTEPRPEVYFGISPATGPAPLDVAFTNLSDDSHTFVWDFGDGTSSDLAEPLHTYAEPGVYTVTLSIFDGASSGSAAVTSSHTVVVYQGLLAQVRLDPAEVTLTPTESFTLEVSALDQFGHAIDHPALVWSMTEGGQIDDGVVIAGRSVGTFADAVSVQATAGGITKTASASLVIKPGPLERVFVEPRWTQVKVGAMAGLQVTAEDWFGNEIEDVTVEWGVPEGAGLLDSEGLFTAGTEARQFPLEARVSQGDVEKSATMTVTVLPGPLHTVRLEPADATVDAGGTRRFTAIASDRFGNELSEVQYVWTVTGRAGAVDLQGNLLASNKAPETGTVQVMAVEADVRRWAEATISIEAGPLAKLSVVPTDQQVGVGGSTKFTAVPRDEFGNPIEDLRVAFSLPEGSGDNAISSSGIFVAGTEARPVEVVATALDVETSKTVISTVTVIPGPLDRAELSPPELEMAALEQAEFTARGVDRHGNEIAGAEADWAVVHDGGTIDEAGMFTAGTEPGTFPDTVQVTISHEGIAQQATATVVVTPEGIALASAKP